MTCCRENSRKIVKYREFQPNYKMPIITEKFYSRYQQMEVELDQHLAKSKKIHKYIDEITKRLEYDQREYSIAPITENQRYGWTEKWAYRPKDDYDRNILFHPKISDEVMKVMRKVVHDEMRDRKYK